MRRIVIPLLLTLMLAPLASAPAQSVRVMSWNLHDFPSGIYNLRKPEVEPQRIAAAAATIRALTPDIVLLQEVRDEQAARELAEALKPLDYRAVACSEFKDRAGIPTFQQLCILARTNAIRAGWSRWTTYGIIDPPRGFAWAEVGIGEVRVLAYSVHLKSNLSQGGDRERENQLNILKRELAADQVVRSAASITATYPMIGCVVVGGDFNTNRENPLFASERTLKALTADGFTDGFGTLPKEQRVTWAGSAGYEDATFDYVLFKGEALVGMAQVIPIDSSLSDHRPVLCEIDVRRPAASRD